MVRAPILRQFDLESAVSPSFGSYNSAEHVEVLLAGAMTAGARRSLPALPARPFAAYRERDRPARAGQSRPPCNLRREPSSWRARIAPRTDVRFFSAAVQSPAHPAASLVVLHRTRRVRPRRGHRLYRLVGDRHGRQLGQALVSAESVAGRLSSVPRS